MYHDSMTYKIIIKFQPCDSRNESCDHLIRHKVLEIVFSETRLAPVLLMCSHLFPTERISELIRGTLSAFLLCFFAAESGKCRKSVDVI